MLDQYRVIYIKRKGLTVVTWINTTSWDTHLQNTTMDPQNVNGFSHTLTTVMIASLIFSAFVLLSKFRHQLAMVKLPAYKSLGSSEQHRLAYMQSALKMYSDGYTQVKTLAVFWSVHFRSHFSVQGLRLSHCLGKWYHQPCP